MTHPLPLLSLSTKTNQPNTHPPPNTNKSRNTTRPENMFLLYFLLFIGFYVISRHLFHNIRNFPPTPFPTFPILGHLHLLKKPLHHSLATISRRHGPILLLQFGSRRVLVISSPSAAEECLAKNDIIFANRPRLLAGKYLGYDYMSLAWAPYGDHWRNMRRIATLEILSSHRLNSLSRIRAGEVSALVRRLARNDYWAQPVDMKKALFELMLNVMMRMIVGKRYYGENAAEAEEAKRFRDIVTETFRIGGATNIGEFLPFLRVIGFMGVEKDLQTLQEKRDRFMRCLLDEQKRETKEKNKNNLIQDLLSLQETEPEYYKDITIRSIMSVLLAAGTDTSAATMEWAMSLLLNHPEVLKKAQAEIDKVVGWDHLVNESDLSRLPYLHNIIKETLRLFPVAPLSVPHESSEGCHVGGYRVPGGTMLLINLYSIQRDPRYWSEPEKFKPERFEGTEGVRDGHRMLPFGSGRRGCPGENLALRMMSVTLGSLIQCFEWGRKGKEPVDMTEATGLTMPKARPLMAKCRPRESMMPLLSQI
ncbi:cytochrome P450 81Q32-like [Punica granatum]|uniref:Cytochrome P450 81Q32-like n=2 Tax=Punica granatum TaxID=22663 RepID=A0A6P8EDG9_PUNGR|nr:cytochrome P450 81Q32-like [Punica granatum]